MTDNLPTGGSTGLDHESTAKIDEAALWFATSSRGQSSEPVILLRLRFGLSAREACVALKEAALIRARSI